MTRLLLCVLLCSAAARAEDPNVETILAKMMAADDERRPRMPEHVSVRRYGLENKRFGTRAAMTVRMSYRDGHKEFQVLEQSGPGPIRSKVFKRMIESETEAGTGPEREATRISPRNYAFRLSHSDVLEGRPCFVLEAEPRTQNKFLFRGKVWVDAEDWAVAKVEGSPARNPSFWVTRTTFTHRYKKFGEQWLPVSNESVSEVKVFGRTTTSINYGEYQFPRRAAAAGTASRPGAAEEAPAR